MTPDNNSPASDGGAAELAKRETVPCGGCGQADPEKRCLGCLHHFYSEANLPPSPGAPPPDLADVERVEELDRAATAGKWHVTDHISPHLSVYAANDNRTSVKITEPVYKDGKGQATANMTLIAEYRTLAPRLAASSRVKDGRIAALTAEVEAVKRELAEWRDCSQRSRSENDGAAHALDRAGVPSWNGKTYDELPTRIDRLMAALAAARQERDEAERSLDSERSLRETVDNSLRIAIELKNKYMAERDAALSRVEQMADDGEPVTVAWLRSVGWRNNVGCQWSIDDGKQWYLTFFDDGPGELYIKAARVCYGPTRGQVRKLASALGLPLPAGGKEEGT